MSDLLDLAAFERLAWSRRTNLQIDRDRVVPLEVVEGLCRLVTAAPNHKRTWPWRFALFTGHGRGELGEAFGDALVAAGTGLDRVATTRSKYLRAPAVLLIGSSSFDQNQATEDRYAVAAGVQNLLLGATAAGLASHWSTPPVVDDPGVLELAGFPSGTEVIAVIYLGWPTRRPIVPGRPPLELRHIHCRKEESTA